MSTLTCRLFVAGMKSCPLPTELTYNPADPYAVKAVFTNPDGDVTEWVFSRELLDDGMRDESGVGDVRIWPGHGPLDRTFIRFVSPEGKAIVEAPTSELDRFLLDSYARVPAGTESAVYDELLTNAAIAAWLSS